MWVLHNVDVINMVAMAIILTLGHLGDSSPTMIVACCFLMIGSRDAIFNNLSMISLRDIIDGKKIQFDKMGWGNIWSWADTNSSGPSEERRYRPTHTYKIWLSVMNIVKMGDRCIFPHFPHTISPIYVLAMVTILTKYYVKCQFLRSCRPTHTYQVCHSVINIVEMVDGMSVFI